MGFSDADLKRAVVAVVGVGARQPDAIAAALRNRGIRVPGGPAALRDRLHHLVTKDLSVATTGGGVIHIPTLLEGTSWTVMVDADDVAEEFVRVHPQLSPLGWWLISDEVSVVDEAGRDLGALHTDGWMLDGEDTDVVLGPAGWLAGLAGGWASVTVVGGNLRWSPCLQPPVATDAQVAAMRTGFDRATRNESLEMQEIGEPTEFRYAFGDLPSTRRYWSTGRRSCSIPSRHCLTCTRPPGSNRGVPPSPRAGSIGMRCAPGSDATAPRPTTASTTSRLSSSP